MQSIAQETGVSVATLYIWLRICKTEKHMTQIKDPNWLAAEQKINLLLTFEGLPEAKRGEFLRSKGLTLQQMNEWKGNPKSLLGDCLVARNELAAAKTETKTQAAANKKLSWELRQKEKALAEAAALLILKKKFQQIMDHSNEE